MSYVVTARKWRPMVFEDVVGQSHVTTTLRNAIASERLSHAYIFSGPRGIGKTTTARILAKAINCLHPKEYNPDNKCELCTEITEGRSVNVFEIDGASNRSIDDIRNLREALRYGPAKGKYKVYIIDEVHMLTKEAFNALLKTLEEPPQFVLFIFATTEVHKVPLTILSRCQRFDFRRVTIDEIVTRLRFISTKEKITIDDDALFLIAKKADGSMRDAQSVFDQIISFGGDGITGEHIKEALNIVDNEIFFRITSLIRLKDTKTVFSLVEEIVSRGYDLREFLDGLNEHFRNLLLALTTGSNQLIEASETHRKRYKEDAASYSETDLLRFIKITTDTNAALRWNQSSSGGRYRLEIALLQMIKMDSSVEIHTLLQQLDALKKKLNGDTQKSFAVSSPSPNTRLQEQQATFPEKNFRPSAPTKVTVETQRAPSLSEQSRQPITQKNTPQPSVTPTLKLSNEDALGKWPSLVEQTRKERIDLWAFLGEANQVKVQEDKLQISYADTFHLDTFKRNREYLHQLAEKIYGGKVKLEAILASAPASQQKESSNTSSLNITSQTPQSTLKNDDEHPVIKALIKEFGAERIE